jgi:glycolate oxidase iron-sulfur subunit
MDVMFNRTNWNSIRLLNAAGYDVVTPAGQGCCGALYAHGGNLTSARQSARGMIGTFGSHSVDFIVINAAGCGSTLKEYGHLLGAEPGWEESSKSFSARVRDLSEILAASENFLALLRERSATGELAGTVTYHDACHLAHAQGIKSAPRELLRAAAGERFVELVEADVCCGSAGSYNLTEPDMAGRLGRRKAGHIQRSGAARVVTANPGCLLQLQSQLRSAGATARAEHLADFLQEVFSRPARRSQ